MSPILRVVSLAALAAALAVPADAFACATCSCGDPTLSAVGAEKPFANRVRAASLIRYWNERLHFHEEGSHTHAQLRELRMDISAAYSPTDWLTLSVIAPLHVRTYEGEASWAGNYAGTGDLELRARLIAARDREFASRHLFSAELGARLPTATPLRRDGVLLPHDAQLTTGSAELLAGASYSFFAPPWSAHTTALLGAPTDGSELNVRWSAMGQRQFGEHVALRGGSEGLFEDEGPKLYAAADAVLSPVTDLVFQLGVRVPFMPANTLNESIAMFATVIDF